MQNVNALFVPTTVYNDSTIKEGKTATSYAITLTVSHLSYSNIADVLGDIQELILQQLDDTLTPQTNRKRKVLSEIKIG